MQKCFMILKFKIPSLRLHGSVVHLSGVSHRETAPVYTCALTLRFTDFTALVLAAVTLYNCARALQEDVECCNSSMIELYIFLSSSRTQ